MNTLRRILITSASVALITVASLATMAASGCNRQAVASALVAELGTDVQAALTIQGVDPATASTITGLFQTASVDIGKWQPGTSGQDAVQALNDATSALSQVLPPGTKVDAYITLALGTAENIITLIQSESGATPAAAPAVAGLARPKSVARTPRVVTLPNPPTTAAQFRKQWAAIGGGVPLPAK